MKQILISTGSNLRVDASNGTNAFTMDEPVDKGGDGVGMTPMETMLSSLAGCTAMTLKLYSARKGWPLEHVNIKLTYEPAGKDTPHRFHQAVELVGDLDAEQRDRLLQIAGRCPVHRALEGPCEFEEELVETLAR
jgi:putative redox protein